MSTLSASSRFSPVNLRTEMVSLLNPNGNGQTAELTPPEMILRGDASWSAQSLLTNQEELNLIEGIGSKLLQAGDEQYVNLEAVRSLIRFSGLLGSGGLVFTIYMSVQQHFLRRDMNEAATRAHEDLTIEICNAFKAVGGEIALRYLEEFGNSDSSSDKVKMAAAEMYQAVCAEGDRTLPESLREKKNERMLSRVRRPTCNVCEWFLAFLRSVNAYSARL